MDLANAAGMNKRVRGLYAITPDINDTSWLVSQCALALRGGARILQYRHKTATAGLAREQASALRALTHSHGARLIINDDMALAMDVAADGVHLGRDDTAAGSIDNLRRKAKSAIADFIVGVSCYDQLSRADDAVAAGADYIAFGSFFPSSTKPHAAKADIALLREARQRFSLPIVVIGGITLANGAPLIAAGADAIATITALFDAADVAAQAKLFSSLFSNHV